MEGSAWLLDMRLPRQHASARAPDLRSPGRKEGAERSAVSLPCVAAVDGSAQEMFDAVAGLAADSSPRHATGFPALLIGDCGLGDTNFSASDL